MPKMRPRFSLGKKIGDERGSDGHEGGLADTHQGVAEQQFSVGVRDRGQQGQPAPENGAQNDDQLARVTVGQRADKRRRDHVEQAEKRW